MLDRTFVTLNFIGFILPLITLPWHLEQKHAAILFAIFYLSFGSFLSFLNGIVFADPVDAAPWLCDITVHFNHLCTIGTIGCFVCIARWLYIIVSPNATVFTNYEKRKINIIDCVVCLGFPAIAAILAVLWQNARYTIIAPAGCFFAPFDNSWVPYALYFIWPLIYSVVGAIYSILTLYNVYRRRKALMQCLQSSMTGISKSRFYRLSALCCSYIFISVGYCAKLFVYNWQQGQPMHSYNFQLVRSTWDMIPILDSGTALWPSYIFFFSSLWFFLFFGLGGEAAAMYKKWARTLFLHKLVPASVVQKMTKSSQTTTTSIQKHGISSFEADKYRRGGQFGGDTYSARRAKPTSDLTFDFDLEEGGSDSTSDYKMSWFPSKSTKSSHSDFHNKSFLDGSIAVTVVQSQIESPTAPTRQALRPESPIIHDHGSRTCDHCRGLIVTHIGSQSSGSSQRSPTSFGPTSPRS